MGNLPTYEACPDCYNYDGGWCPFAFSGKCRGRKLFLNKNIKDIEKYIESEVKNVDFEQVPSGMYQ
jgi:hypothetical protein